MQFIDKLAPLQLNARQFGVLQYIDEHPNASQKQVADALQIDRTTMVGHADDLEKVGYVQRLRNPDDRRSFVLTITKQGQEAMQSGKCYLENTELSVLSALSPEEQKELKAILLKVWGTIQRGGQS